MQGSKSTIAIRIHRMEGHRLVSKSDILAVEEPMELRLTARTGTKVVTQKIAVTMRTPGHDFELAAGFLFTEGLLREPDAIERIEYTTDKSEDHGSNVVTVSLRPWVSVDPRKLIRNFYTTSSCGLCGKASLEAIRVQVQEKPGVVGLTVSAEVIAALPEMLRQSQALFQRTGGLHAAWLCSAEGSLISMREDVGRHNAVDKVVGEQFLAGRTPLSEGVLVLSGRASFEMVQKAAVAGVPVVVAVGAPSSLAVDLAREFGMTLVGFAKQDSFNVYSGQERILL